MKKILTVNFIVLGAITVLAQGNSMDTVKIRPVKITENIYMLKGSGGNIGVLIGRDGTLMIDDQFAPLSNKINGAIKTLDPGEIRFLINTHIHGDHSGGNENFTKIGVSIVAHQNVRERMMNPHFESEENKTTPPRDVSAWPVITFTDKMSLHLNEEDIDIIHLNNGHTDGDVIVHFRKANVYHMGDAFVRYGYPYVDLSRGGSYPGFISGLDKMVALMDDNSKVIPGHGEVATKEDVKILRDRLRYIHDQVAAALKKGKKMEEIPGLGITEKYEAEWGKGFIKGKDFVLLMAEDLKKSSGK
jgi:glyoxylase-like metal-dependent hydrolase (beta-lactamase superfamily II)